MAGLGLQQVARTDLLLTPQQIQLQKLIQMTNLDLEQRIQQEIVENPILEIAENEDSSDDNNETEPDNNDDSKEEENYLDDDVSFEDFLPDADIDESPVMRSSATNDDSKLSNQFSGFVDRVTLTDRLMEQLGWYNLNDELYAMGETIIGNLEESGYLTRELPQMIKELKLNTGYQISLEDAEKVLQLIQNFEPAGIAARNLNECLAIQLKNIDAPADVKKVCGRMLDEFFNLFMNNKFDVLRTKLRITQDMLVDAIGLLKKLNPKPGEGTISEEINHIIPDFIIEKIGETYEITLNDRGSTSVTVNEDYVKIFEQNKRKRKLDVKEKQTHTFIKDKYESAKLFIEAIKQRRKTLIRIMRSIFVRQFEFFENGPKSLKPLLYKDIAEDVQMDIATISRAVKGKYVQHANGIHELKYFFSEGLPTEDGEVLAVKHIKEILKEVMDKEPANKPHSDDKLTELLQEKGIQIARRTVTKYREAMNIPVARLRKRL